jgi:hypothetical protein
VKGPQPFKYLEPEWAKVEACLTKLEMAPDAAAGARSDIECIVNSYLMMAAWDPRSPDAAARKACWAKAAKHALALIAAIEELETLRGLEVFHRTAFAGNSTVIAGILARRHADYLAWKNHTAEVARRAAEQIKSFRKSNGSNRARSLYVDGLFASLLGFWALHCGPVGKGSKSLSTRFVMAATGKFLTETAPAVKLPRAIIDFVSKNEKSYNWSTKPPSKCTE